MTRPKTHRFDTLSLHAGAKPDPATGARATPIHQSAAFVFPDADHAAALFNMERAGHVYSRISNPTCAVLEERVAALEGGVGAIATASGQAALHLAIATIMGMGNHIVASRAERALRVTGPRRQHEVALLLRDDLRRGRVEQVHAHARAEQALEQSQPEWHPRGPGECQRDRRGRSGRRHVGHPAATDGAPRISRWRFWTW